MSEEKAIAPQSEHVAMIPTPGHDLLPEWWTKVFGNAMFKTSLNKDIPEQRRMLLQALNEESAKSDAYVNTVLEMIHFTVLPAGTENAEGEYSEFVRTVIHLANGDRIAFGSMGIVKSLQLIQQLDRPAPWNPPIKKLLVSRAIGGKKRFLYLADPPLPAAPSEPKKAR